MNTFAIVMGLIWTVGIFEMGRAIGQMYPEKKRKPRKKI